MAGAESVKLLGTRQSMFTQRVVWALKLKGIEYEFIEEDLVNKSSLLLRLNPVHKKVPVLVHGENPIIESKIILEYIDETWKGPSLLPLHPQGRAYERFWGAFIDDQLMEASKKAFVSTGDDQVKAIESTVEALQLLEQELHGKQFFGGDQKIGFLDIVAGWIAYWFQFIEEVGGFKVMDSTNFPCLDSWIKTFLQVPTIEQNLPPPDELRNVFGAIRRAMCPK